MYIGSDLKLGTFVRKYFDESDVRAFYLQIPTVQLLQKSILTFKDELRDGAAVLRYLSTIGDSSDEEIANGIDNIDEDVEIFKEKNENNLKTSANWRLEA